MPTEAQMLNAALWAGEECEPENENKGKLTLFVRQPTRMKNFDLVRFTDFIATNREKIKRLWLTREFTFFYAGGGIDYQFRASEPPNLIERKAWDLIRSLELDVEMELTPRQLNEINYYPEICKTVFGLNVKRFLVSLILPEARHDYQVTTVKSGKPYNETIWTVPLGAKQMTPFQYSGDVIFATIK